MKKKGWSLPLDTLRMTSLIRNQMSWCTDNLDRIAAECDRGEAGIRDVVELIVLLLSSCMTHQTMRSHCSTERIRSMALELVGVAIDESRSQILSFTNEQPKH